MGSPVVLVATATTLALLAGLLWITESRDDRASSLNIVLATVVVDAALFPQAGAANGIFEPKIGPFVESLAFLLIPFVLLLRAYRPVRPRFTTASVLWLGFFAWTIVEAGAGVLHHNDHHALLDQLKVVLFVGGAALIAAGTPIDDLLGRRGLPRLATWSAPIAVLLLLGRASHLNLHHSMAVFRFDGTGQLGADCATVLVTIGTIVLAAALTRPAGERYGLGPALLLIVTPLFTGQRASLIGLGVVVLVLAIGSMFRPADGAMRLRTGDGVRLGLAGLIVAAGLATAAAAGHGYSPGKSSVAGSFTSQSKQNSAQSRRNQWSEAERLISSHPVVGYGLGKTYTYNEDIKDAPDKLVTSPLTHDIFLDEMLRGGIVACGLLVLALLASIADGIRAFARRGSAAVTAAGLAGAAAIAGLVARGAVESIFEKGRLGITLGLAVGVSSAALRRTAPAVSESPVRRLVAARPSVGLAPAPAPVLSTS